jgi:hypothetical protein
VVTQMGFKEVTDNGALNNFFPKYKKTSKQT